MTPIAEVLLVNTLTAALLGLVAVALSRGLRRPALAHVLWLLVLVKLVTPPLLRVDALPGVERLRVAGIPVAETLSAGPLARGPGIDAAGAPAGVVASGASHEPAPALGTIAATVWIGGSLSLLALLAWRGRRFRWLVRDAPPAPPSLRRRVDELAVRLGASVPTIRLVAGRVPPMLWDRLSACELYLPERLLQQLEPAELDALLVHELAHVRRRDPLVRRFEAAVLIALWWNPVAWWARSNLRLAEEQACDALVLQALPGASRSYAEGILKTLDFVTGRAPTIPALATGAAEARHMKERLIMIMSERRPKRTSAWQRCLLALALLPLLLVFPGLAPVAEDDEDDRLRRAELIELEREALELERELAEIQARRARLQIELELEQRDLQRAEAHRRADELRREGRTDAAEAIEQKLRAVEHEHEYELALRGEELQRELQLRDAEYELQRGMLDLEEARLAGDRHAAEELERQIRQQELELRHANVDRLRRHERLERERLQRMEREQLEGRQRQSELEERYWGLQKLARERDALREQGRHAEADELADAIAREEAELPDRLRREMQTDHRTAVQKRISELAAELRAVERAYVESRGAQADELRQVADRLAAEIRQLEAELAAGGAR